MSDNCEHFILGTKDGRMFVAGKPGVLYVTNVKSNEEYEAVILTDYPLIPGYPIHRCHLLLEDETVEERNKCLRARQTKYDKPDVFEKRKRKLIKIIMSKPSKTNHLTDGE